MSKSPEMVGLRFGRLTVVNQASGRAAGGQLRWHCRCDCGSETIVPGARLRIGSTRSCGCLQKELTGNRVREHGMTKHRLFGIWRAMMNRCHNHKNEAFARYGGRGIEVCERWHDVRNFIADNDALALPGLSIDRRDNDGPYAPENCRWATSAEQATNRSSNVRLTFEGHTQSLFEWARERGLPPRTLWARIDAGWSVWQALTTPVTDVGFRRDSLITYRGKEATLSEFAKKAGLPRLVVWRRVRKGWPLERALTTPKAYRKQRVSAPYRHTKSRVT